MKYSGIELDRMTNAELLEAALQHYCDNVRYWRGDDGDQDDDFDPDYINAIADRIEDDEALADRIGRLTPGGIDQ